MAKWKRLSDDTGHMKNREVTIASLSEYGETILLHLHLLRSSFTFHSLALWLRNGSYRRARTRDKRERESLKCCTCFFRHATHKVVRSQCVAGGKATNMLAPQRIHTHTALTAYYPLAEVQYIARPRIQPHFTYSSFVFGTRRP